jgi:hypothetical protein
MASLELFLYIYEEIKRSFPSLHREFAIVLATEETRAILQDFLTSSG